MSEKESVNFQIPEMIVVGVDTENRLKDLTPNPSTRMPDGEEAMTESQKLMMAGGGGGEAFFKFITEELFPKIEGDYRTLPYRIYVGHSLAVSPQHIHCSNIRVFSTAIFQLMVACGGIMANMCVMHLSICKT